MTTITKEFTKEQLIAKAQEQIAFCRDTKITGEGRTHVNQCSALFEIALASLTTEPDGLKQAVEFYEQVKQENIPVETGAWKDAVNWVLEEACRAAMLQANQRDLSQPVGPQVAEYEQIMLQAGWVMVPVEPTEEMIAAAMECDDVLFNSDGSFCVQFREIYCAMVDAALALNKGEY
ncbi:TPA: hypothetical protein ACIS20_001889 [Salmonella enterica subsp. enterica serovar Virchow]